MSRNTHHRQRDHFGVDSDTNITVTSGLHTTASGSTLHVALENLEDGLPSRIMTTKGDLVVMNGSGAVVRLPSGGAGNNGKYLMVDNNATNGWSVTTISGGNTTAGIAYVIDGGGAAITTGSKGFVEIPFACTITAWRIAGDQTGSIVVDVKKANYAGLFTTSSIAASAKPTLSSAQKNQDTTLTVWTTTVTAGDWLEFVVDSATTVTRATVSLTVSRS